VQRLTAKARSNDYPLCACDLGRTRTGGAAEQGSEAGAFRTYAQGECGEGDQDRGDRWFGRPSPLFVAINAVPKFIAGCEEHPVFIDGLVERNPAVECGVRVGRGLLCLFGESERGKAGDRVYRQTRRIS